MQREVSFPSPDTYNGCQYHDDCLTCPFTKCLFEHPEGAFVAFKEERDTQIVERRLAGESVRELADEFHISRRSVLRILLDKGFSEKHIRAKEKADERFRVVEIEDEPVTGRAAEEIIANVAQKHNLTPDDLRGKVRLPRIVRARHEAARVMDDLGYNLYEIAGALRKHHTTIMYALGRIV